MLPSSTRNLAISFFEDKILMFPTLVRPFAGEPRKVRPASRLQEELDFPPDFAC